ncbi:MAG: undecaprenyl-diphosphate phosphatase [Actinobacteria bacterium]|nr:undecaprenyl-diphosphate phosphatase [Actinomycetota bacterium]MBO0834161.1 undecaprenyl-diphosphate phosphatase [Actinomycetota bacterium]
MSHLTYLEAMVVGLVQGVTELFPVSSLGHNVLIPALIGGSWAQDLNVSKPESPYLAFIVGLHVATAVAMIAYFWRDWVRIIRGFLSSIAQGRVVTADQRLAWMIILATIPVGIAGLALEHLFRVAFSKPIPTALFLAANGLVLLFGERVRRSRQAARDTVTAGQTAGSALIGAPALGVTTAGETALGPAVSGTAGSALHREAVRVPAPGSVVPGGRHAAGQRAVRRAETTAAVAADARLSLMSYFRAVLIGSAQILALLPGISRDGIVTVTGMFRGLSREDAVRYSFLLSAPVILAAGMLKVPDLLGPLGNGIRGQILVGSLLSGVGAYLSVRFLVRYFRQDRSLAPFAIYCLVAGLGSLLVLVMR